jgi:hypothetical protein
MAIRSIIRPLPAALLLMAAAFGQPVLGQKAAPPPCAANQASTQDKPCTSSSTGTPPSAAEQFPFPSEPSHPIAPSTPAPDAPQPSADKDHPFPEGAPPPIPGSDSSSSSSSSSSSGGGDNYNPDDAASPDKGSAGNPTRKKLPKVEKVQTDDERVDEDLNVAKFYSGRGNFNGAYFRAKDAVKVQPDYSPGHFALAEVAQKLKKNDEAIAEYKAYLKLDPHGEKAKSAQKALDELQSPSAAVRP